MFAYDNVKDNPADREKLRIALEEAVKRQMMSDVPYGVLLSGGLDSSIISAVTQKYAQNRIESGGKETAWWPRLHSFAVGLHGAPDLEKARLVARHIGTGEPVRRGNPRIFVEFAVERKLDDVRKHHHGYHYYPDVHDILF